MKLLSIIVVAIIASIVLLIGTGDVMWLLATFVFSMAGGWQIGRLIFPEAEIGV